jgi:hypothetical protein
MTSIVQARRVASLNTAPASSFAASISAGAIYLGVCAIAALYLGDGGFEVLAATLIGAAVGAKTSGGSDHRLERILDSSYAGMWIGLMLAGLLHEPLAGLAARVFELIPS